MVERLCIVCRKKIMKNYTDDKEKDKNGLTMSTDGHFDVKIELKNRFS